MLQTEHDFTLPKGFIDEDGSLRREGTMRLARAIDELLPLSDVRVKKTPSYLVVVLLARVVNLKGVSEVTPKVIENLFTEDLVFLHNLYRRINGQGDADTLSCPKCGNEVRTQVSLGKG